MKSIQYLTKQLWTLLALVCLCVPFSNAEIRVVIDKAVDSAKPIAVVPFKWSAPGNAPVNIAEIVGNDLRNTGKFSPLALNRMPQLPVSATELTPNLWSAVGIDTVVVGEVKPIASGFEVSYQLVDTVGVFSQPGSVIIEGKYKAGQKDLRYAAHTISDKVFEKLTNIRGAARTRITYIIQHNPRSYSLKVADYDGANDFTIYRSTQPIMSPSWSADGKSVAFSTFEGRKSQLIMLSLGSGKSTVLSNFNGHNGAPAFSPDGRWIAFSASENDGKLNLYIADAQGNNKIKLTNSANNTEPSWTADSREIIFTSDRGGNPAIYKLDISSKTIVNISSGGKSYTAKVSPDTKNLVMVRGDSLMVQNIDTGEVTPITNTYLDESPSVSPNGLMVIYNATQGVAKTLQLVSIDGKFRARLPSTEGQVKYPAWSPYLTNN